MTNQCLVSPGLASPGLASPGQGAPDRAAQLGILASGNGSNFEAIAQAIDRGQLAANLAVLIYNNPGAGVIARAERWKVPTILHDHRQYDSREALDQALVSTLKAHGVDWVIMAGWMRRVTQHLIDAFPDRMLNIHPSLLPSFPGLRAVEQALDAGVTLAGCTVHYVELAVDSGPIVMQAAVPVLPDDTVTSLQRRIQTQEHRIYPAAIARAIAEG
ncbi:MAG: phosphoribosylglycinamide formyltransferase [Cyanobacteria bacterium P01_A01_bin.105]